MKLLNKFFIPFFIFTISMSMFSQKYELTVTKRCFDDSFEVRLYDPVLKAKTFSSEGSNNNFGKLFRYISGYNQKNEKIAMTFDIYETGRKGSMMEFVLPSKFNMDNVSMPKSQNVESIWMKEDIMHPYNMGVILTTTNVISIRKP